MPGYRLILWPLLDIFFGMNATAAGQGLPPERPADCSAYAGVPLPAEAERVPVPTRYPECAAYRSYRGIDRPVNYTEARACAWQERLAQQSKLPRPNQRLAPYVGGSLILANLYVNGAGVKRDVALALRFACEAEEGLALSAIREVPNRIPARRPQKLFEFCDYASATYSMNFCAAYAAEVQTSRRNRYFESLRPSMSAEQRWAFDRLRAAQDAYADAHALEVDQGGTIHVMRTIRSQEILHDLFRARISLYERNAGPVFSAVETTSAESWMQREYNRELHRFQLRPKSEIDLGTVTAQDLVTAQIAWQAYRAAWIEYARRRHPAAVERIRTDITLERYRLLKTMGE